MEFCSFLFHSLVLDFFLFPFFSFFFVFIFFPFSLFSFFSFFESIGDAWVKDFFGRYWVKDGNIGFNRYIGTWILRIYRYIFLHEYRYTEN